MVAAFSSCGKSRRFVTGSKSSPSICYLLRLMDDFLRCVPPFRCVSPIFIRPLSPGPCPPSILVSSADLLVRSRSLPAFFFDSILAHGVRPFLGLTAVFGRCRLIRWSVSKNASIDSVTKIKLNIHRSMPLRLRMRRLDGFLIK